MRPIQVILLMPSEGWTIWSLASFRCRWSMYSISSDAVVGFRVLGIYPVHKVADTAAAG